MKVSTFLTPVMATKSFSPIKSRNTVSFSRASTDSVSDVGNLRTVSLKLSGLSSVRQNPISSNVCKKRAQLT